MDIEKVLMSNYLPYAKGTIISRAIPQIDGLKPSQRRLLYTMHKMGLGKENANRSKSSKVCGQTMTYHPHGDGTIYDTAVRMSVDHEGLNVPYIDSKGNFGKVYSSDLQYAASRYTEVKLTRVCAELFDGIDEDAVDFMPNFDNTEVEPTILPVKFPNILVNPSKGIAVGTSSNIPCFALKNVCKATQEILRNNVTTCEELADILGVPEFTSGGFIHADKNALVNLVKTGHGSFTYSGTVTTYPNKIVIYEIPYNTTCEEIKKAIVERVKSGELKEVSDVSNDIDIKGFRMTVNLKRGANPAAVLKKLCRMTTLRTQISFRTRVVIDNRCRELGLLELLHEWIKFRQETLKRVYRYRLNKKLDREHILSVWEVIKPRLREVVKFISENNTETVRTWLKNVFSFDDVQIDYILDIKLSNITVDKADKSIKELYKLRDEIKDIQDILVNEARINQIIIDEQDEIIKLYGKDSRVQQAPMIVEEKEPKEEEVISDEKVMVIVTKNFYMKRFVTLREIQNYTEPENDKELLRFNIKNNDYLLVFTCDGTVHKILVNDIDASRGGFKETIASKIGLDDPSKIIWIDNAGDYKGYFNLVYPNGRGTRVYYSRATGKRSKYIGLFQPCEPKQQWITRADKFFIITRNAKASYCDLSLLGMFSARSAFKVARISSGDSILGIQPIEKVPDINAIDIERYSKEYTVKIGEDKLW